MLRLNGGQDAHPTFFYTYLSADHGQPAIAGQSSHLHPAFNAVEADIKNHAVARPQAGEASALGQAPDPAAVVGYRSLVLEVDPSVRGDDMQLESPKADPQARRRQQASGPQAGVGCPGVGQGGVLDEPVVVDAVCLGVLKDGGS